MFRCFKLVVIVSSASPAVIAGVPGPASGADLPVTGDWDGNNTTTIGVVRPESNNWRWLLRNSNSGGTPSSDLLFGSAE